MLTTVTHTTSQANELHHMPLLKAQDETVQTGAIHLITIVYKLFITLAIDLVSIASALLSPQECE